VQRCAVNDSVDALLAHDPSDQGTVHDGTDHRGIAPGGYVETRHIMPVGRQQGGEMAA